MVRVQRFFALDFLLVAVAFAVRRFRVAAAFFPAATRLVDFRAVDLFAVDFLRAGLRAAVFFAAVFRRPAVLFLVAAAFLAPVFLRAVVRFLVAAAFFPAATRLVDFRPVDLFAVDRFRAAVFRAAIPSPFPSWTTKDPSLTTPSV